MRMIPECTAAHQRALNRSDALPDCTMAHQLVAKPADLSLYHCREKLPLGQGKVKANKCAVR